MLRLVLVLATLFAWSPAIADELTRSDLIDQAKRIDTRTLHSYDRALDNRDFFATLHDSIWHGAYKELKASRNAYAAQRAKFDKTLATGDTRKATDELDALESAGEDLSDKLERYNASSASSVEKIQIGLGVFAFLIAGVVYLLIKRRKQKPTPQQQYMQRR